MSKSGWFDTGTCSSPAAPLSLTSYMTTTFVIEAMAAANAQLRWKRREQEEVRKQQQQ